mgnify:CR=1 FL=1
MQPVSVPVPGLCCLASMGPRSEERGDPRVKPLGVHVSFASMGPRSEERGDTAGLANARQDAQCFNGAAL